MYQKITIILFALTLVSSYGIKLEHEMLNRQQVKTGLRTLGGSMVGKASSRNLGEIINVKRLQDFFEDNNDDTIAEALRTLRLSHKNTVGELQNVFAIHERPHKPKPLPKDEGTLNPPDERGGEQDDRRRL